MSENMFGKRGDAGRSERPVRVVSDEEINQVIAGVVEAGENVSRAAEELKDVHSPTKDAESTTIDENLKRVTDIAKELRRASRGPDTSTQ